MEGVAHGDAYQVSFGSLPHDTCYQNPYGLQGKAMTVDMRADDGLLKQAFKAGLEKYEQKAHSISGLSALTGISAGVTTIPVYLDPRIIDTTRKYTPLVELIPRVTCSSNVYSYVNITAKGGAFTASEDAALSETNTTYARSSTAIKYLYSVGRVTGPAIAAQPSYILEGMTSTGDRGAFVAQAAPNAKQQEVLVKTREIRELEESLIVNGNASSDATQFSGIVTLMSTTNTVAKGTTALTLGDIDTAIRYAFDDGGRPNLAVCSSGVYTDLLGLLTAKVGYMQATGQVFWGFTTIVLHTMVGDIPVIPSMYLSNTSGSKAMYFLDMSVVMMAVLQDLTYFELAKTNDSEKFALKIYEALVIKNTSFCASITAISG